MDSGIFLGLISGRMTDPSQLKNQQKLHKMVYIITNFIDLHFHKNFMNTKATDAWKFA